MRPVRLATFLRLERDWYDSCVTTALSSFKHNRVRVKLTAASYSRSLSLQNIVLRYECGTVLLSVGCRARFILKRGSQLPFFAIQAADLQAEEAAWLNKDGVHPVCLLLVPSS